MTFFDPTEIKSVILADYTRYKAKHQGVIEAIEDHKHGSINEIYFSFYRIAGELWHIDQSFDSTLKTYFTPFSVYIWTLLGISWLFGLISLIFDSASKVALKTRSTNLKNREEKDFIIRSESEHL